MSNKVKTITETMCHNDKAMGLVSMMRPIELMKALVKHKELMPKDAAKVVLDLKKKAEGMASPGIETNKMYPVPSSMKDGGEDDDVEEGVSAGGNKIAYGQGGGPDVVKRHHFPPDPRPSSNDYPYDDTFVNYMNNPKRKRPMTSGKEIDQDDLTDLPIKPGGTRAGNVKYKFPMGVDLRLGQPGGDAGGSGIYSKGGVHSRDNDMPSQGTSWSTRGTPGWASTLRDKEFERPPQAVGHSEPVEQEVSVGGAISRGPDNAGDNEEDIPSFMKEPNVGSQLSIVGYGGSTPIRISKAGYRGYGRK